MGYAEPLVFGILYFICKCGENIIISLKKNHCKKIRIQRCNTTKTVFENLITYINWVNSRTEKK